jgi:rhamnosyltransferase
MTETKNTDIETDCTATVSILTFNGEQYLEEIINAIQSQKVDFNFEILIIDSGSTDNTLNIINRFVKVHKNIRLHQIPNSEFGHGKTRNLVAQMAKGQFVVYLTHDATPSSDRWLYEIIKPMQLHDRIVAVMGRQLPRPHCFPLLKYEIIDVFNNFGPSFGTTIFYKDDFIADQATYDAVRFYSDVNSATRKEFLLKNPYKDVNYAEDQMYGETVLELGQIKAYSARAAVVHSNDLKLSEYRSRMFDETYGLRKNGIAMPVPSWKLICKMIFKNSIRDSLRIVRDKEYSGISKLYWLLANPIYHIEKWRGVRYALTIDEQEQEKLKKQSLEAKRREKAS